MGHKPELQKGPKTVKNKSYRGPNYLLISKFGQS